MSQRQLAFHLDVTDRTVRRWESELNPWPVPTLAQREIHRMIDTAAAKAGLSRAAFMKRAVMRDVEKESEG